MLQVQADTHLQSQNWRRCASHEGSTDAGLTPCANLEHARYNVLPIPRNEHCLFTCFVEILRQHDVQHMPETQETMREAIAGHFDRQGGAVAHEGAQYPCDDAARTSGYGGVAEVLAFASMYKVSIEIHSPETFPFVQKFSCGSTDAEPELLLHTLGWNDDGSRSPSGDHWQRLSKRVDTAFGSESSDGVNVPRIKTGRTAYFGFLGLVLVISSLLSCFHVHLVLQAAATITVTFDETAHVGAGVTFWKYKDFRLNPENGVLPQLIAGGGITWGRPGVNYTIPTFKQQAWRYSDCWSIGFQLLHESGNNLQNLLHDGRRGIAVRRAQPRSPCCQLTRVCLQVCSGIMVFSTGLIAFFAFISIAPSHSASSLAASAVAAAVACTQCAFDPSLIAHGGLMTSDTVLSLFWLISPVLLWHAIIIATVSSPLQTASRPPLFRRLLSFMSTLLYLVTTGAATGLLIAAKHSGVLVAPVIIMFLAVLVMMLRDNACPAIHTRFV